MKELSKLKFTDYMMWAAFALIMIHLDGYKSDNVFWEVYYKFVHDLIIIGFSLSYAYNSKTHPIGAITGIGFASYFCAPIMMRLNLSITYFENYKAYRLAITNGKYSFILLSYALLILLAIYAVKSYYEFRRNKRTT